MKYIDYLLTHPPHTQSSWLCDAEGRLLVDFVGRVEHIYDDLGSVGRRLGLRPLELPQRNRSKHDDYRTYYNDRTREQVAEHFREDIERFGYTFDGLRPDASSPVA